MVITNSFLTNTRTDVVNFIDSKFLYGAVGSASATHVASGTALGFEFFRDSIDDSSSATPGVITTSLRIESTEANGNNIREFGLFETSAGSSGTAWILSNLTTITKTSDIQLFIDNTTTVQVIEV